MSKSNEDIFIEYILEKGCKTLTSEWVIWMLGFIDRANADDAKINPAYLRASHVFSQTGTIEEPIMTLL